MKKIVFILIFILIPTFLMAQTFLSEDFSGAFPPAGWSIDAHAQNWHINGGNNAGGIAPEAVFDWSPQFNGYSRLISPELDLTDVTILKFEFKHMLDHYGGAYTIGVATRSGGSSWHIVWQRVNPSGNIPATTEVVDVENNDVGASDFQICWFFSGSSYNLDYWYLDDIMVFQPLEHDARVKAINVNSQYAPGSIITPQAVVENFGLNPETFSVSCDINIGEDNVYSEAIQPISVDPGEDATVEFPDFAISAENELYEVVVTTLLEGDMDPSNDTMNKFFNTYTTEREMVVLEIGTGTWCQYCPGAAMGAEDLVDYGHDVAVVEYHNGDPFANSYSNARNTYYGISGFPTAVFDGVDKFVGGSNNQSMYAYYLPIYQARKQINSAFTIEIYGENDGNDYDLTIIVNKLASIAYQDMVLHVALTESDISYNWQGQNHLEWVERLMTPDENGTAIDFSSGNTVDVNVGFTFNNSWEYEHCELSVFIQHLNDKEILQGAKIMLPDLTPTGIEDNIEASLPLVTELGNNYPNPFNPATTISFSLKEAGEINIDVHNIIGQKVRTLTDGYWEAGHHSVLWDGKNENGMYVSSGVYFYRFICGDYTESKKMILIK